MRMNFRSEDRMNQDEWEYDTVFFVGQIRRSGGSLVITIPTELKNRFLISEGQKVRIIGLVRKKPYAEGGLLVYLGRFIVDEETKGLVVSFELPEDINKDEVLNKIYVFFSSKYQATNILVKSDEEDNKVMMKIWFGSITDKGVIVREENFLEKVTNDFKEICSEYNIKIEKTEKIVDKIVWDSVDPSVLKRYLFSIPENIKYEWKIL